MQELSLTESIGQSAKELLQCQWVVDELRNVDFGDSRLRNRFLVIAKRLANQPSASICECGEDWGLVKSAYRFFDNPKVSAKRVLEPHKIRSSQRAARHKGKVLVIQDTTSLNYTHLKSATDLGHIGKNKNAQGLMVHQSLAVTESGIPLGCVEQKIWSRKEYRDEPDKNEIARTPIEEKESFRWLESLRSYDRAMSRSDYITVCDREAHIYEFFDEAQSLGAQVLVRARRPESIGAKSFKLVIKKQPLGDTYIINVPDKERERLREAKVELRYGKVKVQKPDRIKDSPKYANSDHLEMYYVALTEIDTPKEEEPISWLLISNIKISSVNKAKKLVKWYRVRWQIEIFFRILKSGCKIEDSLLRKNCRREPYIALQSIIAWRLLLMVNYTRACPTAPATTVFTQTECDALVSTVKGEIVRDTKINMQSATYMLAQLGGFLKRNNNEKPGPTVIWRAWERLQDLTLMFVIATEKMTSS